MKITHCLASVALVFMLGACSGVQNQVTAVKGPVDYVSFKALEVLKKVTRFMITRKTAAMGARAMIIASRISNIMNG